MKKYIKIISISVALIASHTYITVYAIEIDLNIISKIESSNNPLAYNPTSGARGLYQITPICLDDYNQYHDVSFSYNDLFDVKINEKVAKWYLLKRIPQLLKHYKHPITLENVIISYNWGILNINKTLPTETRNYIKKYKKLYKKT